MGYLWSQSFTRIHSSKEKLFFIQAEFIELVSISVSDKQNISVATLVVSRDYNSHLNLVYRCYIVIISSNGSSSGNTGNSRSDMTFIYS